MHHRTLGCTGLKLSEFCLGTMNFGWRTDESTSFALLDAYHASGGRFLQARASGPHLLDGPSSLEFSESIVGRWWHARGLPRDQFVLATRMDVTAARSADPDEFIRNVRQNCEASLRRFDSDYLDLLVCECADPDFNLAELRPALDRLVREGLIRYVGLANFPAWQVLAGIRDGYERNHSRIDALQADYSLLARPEFEREAAGLCREYRLGFIARSALAGGLLTRHPNHSLALGTSRLRWLAERYGFDCGDKVIRELGQLAREKACTPAQVALAWVLHNPVVTSVLIGVTSVPQLRELLAADQVELSSSECERLERASRVQRVPVSPRQLRRGQAVAPLEADSPRPAEDLQTV